jgi:transcriptional regulator with XRE-family HTH domain
MPSRKATEMSVFVTFLRSLRAWSQAELAAAAMMSQRMISRYERGISIPREPTLDRLAGSVGLPLSVAKQFLPAIRRSLAILETGTDAPPEEAFDAARARIAAVVSDVVQSSTLKIQHELSSLAKGLTSLPPAEELWEALEHRPAWERRVLIEGAKEYRSWDLAVRLCDESRRAVVADVGQAIELAALAVRLAELVPGGEVPRHRLQAFAYAFLGNARRVAGDLPAADEAFAEVHHLREGLAVSDLLSLEEWRVFDLEASLRREQRRWERALRLHDEALALAPVDEHGRVLLNKAVTLEQSGDHQRALATLDEAAASFDALHERRLAFALHTNRVLNLCRLGRFTEVQASLQEARRLGLELGNPLDLVRLRWLEALAAAGLGRTSEAIDLLSEVRTEFLSRGITFDAALATLELAVLLLEVGRTRDAKELAVEVAPIFHSQGVDRETLAAFKLFREAAEREVATVEMARGVVACLYRAQRRPELEA